MEDEIERRFLVDELPASIPSASRNEILQGYLNRTPLEIRIRKIDNKYILTEKTGTGKTRKEHEEQLCEEKFASFSRETQGTIEKTHYKLKRGKRVLEIDVYRGKHE